MEVSSNKNVRPIVSNQHIASSNTWSIRIDNYRDLADIKALTPDSYAERAARFDQRLLEELYERLAIRRDIETRDLHLEAHSGTVMLEGSVGGSPMKTHIESIVTACPYVRAVINHLKIRDGGDMSAHACAHSQS